MKQLAPTALLALLLALLAPGCGGSPRPVTSAFDGPWLIELTGDCLSDLDGDGAADRQSLSVAGGLVTASLTLAAGPGGASCPAGTFELSGTLHPGAGEPLETPAFADALLWLASTPEPLRLDGSLTGSGGSGTWSTSGGLTGSFLLLPL